MINTRKRCVIGLATTAIGSVALLTAGPAVSTADAAPVPTAVARSIIKTTAVGQGQPGVRVVTRANSDWLVVRSVTKDAPLIIEEVRTSQAVRDTCEVAAAFWKFQRAIEGDTPDPLAPARPNYFDWKAVLDNLKCPVG